MTYYPKEGKLYLAQLKAYAKEHGHVPSFKEADAAPELPPANNFAFYFGSYSDAADIVAKQLEIEKAREESEKADDQQITFYEAELSGDDDIPDNIP